MAKFNVRDKRHQPSPGPLGTEANPTGLTGNGAPGFAYEDKSALFLMSVTSFFGQDKRYAKAKDEDKRFVDLVRTVTKTDPAWMIGFLTWLRNSGNMRSSAVVGSIEAALVAKASEDEQPSQKGHQEGFARRLAKSGIGRTDEIGEATAYFQATYPGKQLPKPIKRGLADVEKEKINEYSAAKYSGTGKAWTLGQLTNVLHPKPSSPWQADLFGYLVAKEYGEVEVPDSLHKTRLRKALMEMPVGQRKEFIYTNTGADRILKDAGMTWEALAGWLQGPMDAKAWEAIIPSMGYFALLRNLRNFDEAKISNAAAAIVMAKLANEDEVKRSKLFPFRFLAAYKNAPHARWGGPLSMALDASLANIPVLPGRTLVLVDTSGSMNSKFSEHSEMMRWDAAALFGIALGKAAEGVDGSSVDVVSYSEAGSYRAPNYGFSMAGSAFRPVTQTFVSDKPFKLTRGADVLTEMKNWISGGFNIGGGTDTFGAMNRNYRSHDRVILLTDEQTSPGVTQPVPANKHVFVFNLAGYRFGQQATGKFRHSFGGLTDACFPLISQIEQSASGRWPWESGD